MKVFICLLALASVANAGLIPGGGLGYGGGLGGTLVFGGGHGGHFGGGGHHVIRLIHQAQAPILTAPVHTKVIRVINQAPLIHHAPIIHHAPPQISILKILHHHQPVLHHAPVGWW